MLLSLPLKMPPVLPVGTFLLLLLLLPAILFGLLWLPGCSGAQGKFAYKLLKDLFTNYSSALRPAEDTDRALNVTLQVTLSQIIDMDERNQVLTTYLWIRQVWTDAYLSWEKEAYDGLDSIRIPSGFVWRPDIVLYNNADDQFASSMETNVVIRYDGQITWDSPSITRSSCKVDVSYFPFDGQQCRLTFGSWTYNGNQIDLQNRQDSADLADFVENVEWEVLGMPAERNVVVYGCCSDPYPDVTYTLRLQRRASFYVVNLLLPCLLVSFLAPLGFYLPADSGEKVSLGVTVLLALTVFQLLVAESMPPSENVPLIGKYYIATMTLIAASTALTIFVLNLHHCGPAAKPLPRWAKKVILGYLARLVFVYEVGESCRNPWRDPDPLPTAQAADRRSAGQRMASPQEEGSPRQGLGHSSSAGLPDWSQAGMFVDLEGGGGGDGRGPPAHRGKSPCFCPHRSILRNVQFIASCFRDQKAASKRAGEWKKVAKVLDRFFMWLFFAMVFLMSALVMGQA